MALFTDGPPSSIEDLTAHDSQLLNVANVESIDVTRKIAIAWDEIGVELHGMLNVFGTHDWTLWQTPKARLDAVVVTTPLKLWHAYRALQLVYEDAYNSQLNDRYAGKRDRFGERAAWAREKLIELGVGIAETPVARAGRPSVTAFSPGAHVPDGTYYVTMAWVNGQGEEGSTAELTGIEINGSTFQVRPGGAPPNAAGWNVYVGTDPDWMYMQNGSAISPGQTWFQPASVTQTGRIPGSGQKVTFFRPAPRVLQRG